MKNKRFSFRPRLPFTATRRAGVGLRPWALAGSTALSLAALLWGCGGGVGSGGTGGFASGPITGFGSVIVNEVRFEDSNADISNADGNRLSRDDLRLGMTVEVDSGAIANNSSGVAAAVASRIRVESELRGPVTAVQLAAGTFTVLGQQVLVTGTTLFGELLPGGAGSGQSSGLAALTGPGAPPAVEVYAVYDASSGRYRALRVDPAPADATLRLRGPLQQLDTPGQTVRIGGASYALQALAPPPSGLNVGQIVRLQLQPSGTGPSLQVKGWGGTVQPASDTDSTVKLRGVVSAYSSLSSFSIDGRPVNGSAALSSPAGAVVALGVRVDVEGAVRGGVLHASKVLVSSDNDDYERGFELSGTITAVTATPTPGQPLVVLRGQTISTARPDLRFDNGSAALLTVGRQVEIKAQLSADRRTVEATRVKFQ